MIRGIRLPGLLLPALLLLPAARAQGPPNVVLILVDDQGYYDLGCYGATEVDTPRLDALAAEGVRFADYYAAAPICSPSRAGLLTGRYPRRLGLETWVQRADSTRGIPAGVVTLAELFQTAGYATACIGKWHLGFAEPFLPRRQGFDEYVGLLHNLDPVETVYFDGEGGVPLVRNESIVERPANPDTLTRRYTDEALTFVEHNRDRPFFLYLAHTMLHEPLGVGEAFRGRSRWGRYGDAIQELDHHVGRLQDGLEAMGLADRTVIVYASDNGRGPGRTGQQPLRGHKLSTWEGGMRVPCLAWGPGVGIRSGHVSRALVHAMDWYPTLASLAGVDVPAGQTLDGRDLSPLLEGRMDDVPAPGASASRNGGVLLRRPWDPPLEWRALVQRDEYLNAFFYHGSHGALAAVRWGRWKLFLNPQLQLYDLEADPGERTPVRNTQITRKLRGMAILFQLEMQDAGARWSPTHPMADAEEP